MGGQEMQLKALITVLAVLTSITSSYGQARYAMEAAEAVLKRFGASMNGATARSLAVKIEQQVARHGQKVLPAVSKVGPRALTILEEVGASHASRALRVMAEHGEAGVVNILSRPKALQLASRIGVKAESALLKHPGIAENVMERFGEPAAHALSQLGPQAGRRLAMLHESGELVKLGRTEEVLKVIGTYGDKAMQFIWKHKGALAVSSSLAVFLSEPEAVLNGTVSLVSTLATPIVEIPRNIATEAARSLNWTWVVTLVVAVLAGMWFLKQRMSLSRS